MAESHYENFPVASILMPRRLRPAVRLIYSFARQADDFADEGELAPEERLQLLDGFRRELDRIEEGCAPHQRLFRELAPLIAKHRLPLQAFRDLLNAFAQDVTKTRYANFSEVMDYCRRSANPVGHLLLHLYEAAAPKNIAHSDAICSALQLINFLQDVAIDWRKGRVYLPQDEMARWGVSETQIAAGDTGGAWRTFMLAQIERARDLLHSGAPLGDILRGRLGLEMRMIIQGGDTILRKLQQNDGDIFRQRPVLGIPDWGYMLYRSVLARSNPQ